MPEGSISNAVACRSSQHVNLMMRSSSRRQARCAPSFGGTRPFRGPDRQFTPILVRAIAGPKVKTDKIDAAALVEPSCKRLFTRSVDAGLKTIETRRRVVAERTHTYPPSTT